MANAIKAIPKIEFFPARRKKNPHNYASLFEVQQPAGRYLCIDIDTIYINFPMER